MRSILITGGAGFIGSHLVKYAVNNYPHYQIINLDALTYAGDLKRLHEVERHTNYKFIHGNICNTSLVEDIFKSFDIDGVMHLAAESHVDNSINGPSIFIETNVNGTLSLLEAARKYWKNYEEKKFLHVSTDEVYGSLPASGYFTEETPYSPNSPYSASKAASDLLVRSYFHTYSLPIVISNCSNNFGTHQHDEKLIPTIIRNALLGKNIPIYGNGQNIRDWLHVHDHCTALDLIFHKGIQGERYNIGLNNEKSNIQITKFICNELDNLMPKAGSYFEQVEYVRDRLGHDFRYAIDNSKIRRCLNWAPCSDFEEMLRSTISWYYNRYLNDGIVSNNICAKNY